MSGCGTLPGCHRASGVEVRAHPGRHTGQEHPSNPINYSQFQLDHSGGVAQQKDPPPVPHQEAKTETAKHNPLFSLLQPLDLVTPQRMEIQALERQTERNETIKKKKKSN